MDEEGSNEGHPMHNTIVLEKQDEAAAEPLRKAGRIGGRALQECENRCAEGFARIAIHRIHMHYFSWSLGKDCEFCHVDRKLDSDDKKEKQTARKMIDMVAAINEHNFESKPEVRCFTCHEGNGHPLVAPAFRR